MRGNNLDEIFRMEISTISNKYLFVDSEMDINVRVLGEWN